MKYDIWKNSTSHNEVDYNPTHKAPLPDCMKTQRLKLLEDREKKAASINTKEQMNVRLVSYTKFTDEQDTEALIAYVARVSNPSNQNNHETAPRLISFLLKQAHWSPFDMTDITFEIKTSRAIGRQLLRHRSFYFQEFSQRYAEVTATEPVELRKASKNNRQSSEERVDDTALDTLVNETIKNCLATYETLLDKGVAKECARFILPECASTTIYMKGTLRQWIHFLDVRLEKATQKEARELAEAVKPNLAELFPLTFSALDIIHKEKQVNG
jgi:thymidylate synthase (FAD)